MHMAVLIHGGWWSLTDLWRRQWNTRVLGHPPLLPTHPATFVKLLSILMTHFPSVICCPYIVEQWRKLNEEWIRGCNGYGVLITVTAKEVWMLPGPSRPTNPMIMNILWGSCCSKHSFEKDGRWKKNRFWSWILHLWGVFSFGVGGIFHELCFVLFLEKVYGGKISFTSKAEQ